MRQLILVVLMALPLLACDHVQPSFSIQPGQGISVGVDTSFGVGAKASLTCQSSLYQSAVGFLDKIHVGGLLRTLTGCD